MTDRQPIPFFRPDLPDLGDYVRELEQIWSTRMLSNFATYSQQLEAIAEAQLAAKRVFAVVSGDIGLMLGLTALERPRGAPCYISSFTFQSTVNAALWAGYQPVLVDIERDTFNMSPASLAEATAQHGPGAVLATHVFGNPVDVGALGEAAGGSPVACDAAHAYGSHRDGVPAGSLGAVEVFSLSGTKLVTTAEGGLVSTNDDDLIERLEYLRAYGFLNDYNSLYVGMNGKMSELHAALGGLTLPTVEDAIVRRHQIVDGYHERLGDHVGWQAVRPTDRCTYKDIMVLLGDRRDDVEAALLADQVGVKRYFRPLHYQKPYADFATMPLPVTEEIYESGLCIPAFSTLTDADLDRIGDTVLATLGVR